MSARLAALVLPFLAPACWAADCDIRLPTPAEQSAHKQAFASLQKASGAPPAGWAVKQESPLEELTEVCKAPPPEPTRYEFFRRYEKAQAADELLLADKVPASAAKAQDKKAAQIAELDKKAEELLKRMETATAADRKSEVASLGKELNALYSKQAELERGDLSAEMGKADAKPTAPAPAVELTVTANSDSVSLVAFKPLAWPGVPQAFRQQPSPANPEEATLLLFGKWKVSDDGLFAEPAVSLLGKPRAKIHGIVVRVQGAPDASKALLKQLDPAKFKSLIN